MFKSGDDVKVVRGCGPNGCYYVRGNYYMGALGRVDSVYPEDKEVIVRFQDPFDRLRFKFKELEKVEDEPAGNRDKGDGKVFKYGDKLKVVKKAGPNGFFYCGNVDWLMGATGRVEDVDAPNEAVLLRIDGRGTYVNLKFDEVTLAEAEPAGTWGVVTTSQTFPTEAEALAEARKKAKEFPGVVHHVCKSTRRVVGNIDVKEERL